VDCAFRRGIDMLESCIQETLLTSIHERCVGELLCVRGVLTYSRVLVSVSELCAYFRNVEQ